MPRGRPYQKGQPKTGGRKRGTPNKRTVFVREVLEGAARSIGGMDRFIARVKEDPQNERLFWTSMFMRLLPVNVRGHLEHDEHVVVEVKREDLARQLEQRGLPLTLLGTDLPQLRVALPLMIGGNHPMLTENY